MTHHHTTSNRTFWKRMTGFLGTTSLALGLLCGAPSGAFADTDTTDRQTSKEQQLKRKMDELRKQYNRLRRDKRRKARTKRRPAPRRRYRTRRDDDRRYRRQDDRYDRRGRRRRYDRRDDRRTRSRYDRRDDRYDTRRDTRRRRRDRYDRYDRYDRRDTGRRYTGHYAQRRSNRDYHRMGVNQKSSMFRPSTRRFVVDLGIGGSAAFTDNAAPLFVGSLLFGAHLSGRGEGFGFGGSIDFFKNLSSSIGPIVQTLLHTWFSLHIKGGFYVVPYVALGFTWVEQTSGSFKGFFQAQPGLDLKLVFDNRFYVKVRPLSLDVLFGDSISVRYAGSAAFGVTF